MTDIVDAAQDVTEGIVAAGLARIKAANEAKFRPGTKTHTECVDCGFEIESDRLKLYPYTDACGECAGYRQQENRMQMGHG